MRPRRDEGQQRRREGVAQINDPRCRPARLELVLHCSFPGDLTVGQVHARSAEIERHLHNALPPLASALIHAEPAEEHHDHEPPGSALAHPLLARIPTERG